MDRLLATGKAVAVGGFARWRLGSAGSEVAVVQCSWTGIHLRVPSPHYSCGKEGELVDGQRLCFAGRQSCREEP